MHSISDCKSVTCKCNMNAKDMPNCVSLPAMKDLMEGIKGGVTIDCNNVTGRCSFTPVETLGGGLSITLLCGAKNCVPSFPSSLASVDNIVLPAQVTTTGLAVGVSMICVVAVAGIAVVVWHFVLRNRSAELWNQVHANLRQYSTGEFQGQTVGGSHTPLRALTRQPSTAHERYGPVAAIDATAAGDAALDLVVAGSGSMIRRGSSF